MKATQTVNFTKKRNWNCSRNVFSDDDDDICVCTMSWILILKVFCVPVKPVIIAAFTGRVF